MRKEKTEKKRKNYCSCHERLPKCYVDIEQKATFICKWTKYEKSCLNLIEIYPRLLYLIQLREIFPNFATLLTHFNAKHHTSSCLDIDPILPTPLFSSTNLGRFHVPPPSSILVRNHWLTTLIVLGWNEVSWPHFDSDKMATLRNNTSRIRFLERNV